MKKVLKFGFVFLVFTSTVFAQEGFVNRPITNNLWTPTGYTLNRGEFTIGIGPIGFGVTDNVQVRTNILLFLFQVLNANLKINVSKSSTFISNPLEAQQSVNHRFDDLEFKAAFLASPMTSSNRHFPAEFSSISLNRIPLKATLIDQNGQTKVSITRPIIGGILAGTIGFFGGAALGLAIEQGVGCDDTNEMCGLGGLILGAAIGEVLFTPVGIHLGNKREGNFFLDTLSSIAVAAAGLGASALSKGSIGPFLVVTPIIQIGITTIVERSF